MVQQARAPSPVRLSRFREHGAGKHAMKPRIKTDEVCGMSEMETAGVETETGADDAGKAAERALLRPVGRALCRLDGAGGAEMKARWAENRTEYLQQARKLIRAMGKEGLAITSSGPTASDAA
jgi:hypothetical protein